MRKWRNKSDFESSNEILAINVGVIIFEIFHLKTIFELSCRIISYHFLSHHVISCHFLSYFFVVYNSNVLGLYLNLKFWEEKFLRSAIVTKSNNQSIYFKTILLINHRNYEENFSAVWERCLREKLFSTSKFIQVSLFSLLFFLSAAFLADSASWWI